MDGVTATEKFLPFRKQMSGIKTQLTAAQETLSSQCNRFFGHLDWPKRALLIALSQAILISGFEIVVLSGTLSSLSSLFGIFSGTSAIVIVYFIIFILAQFFQALLALDAWWFQNTMQAVAIAVFNACTTVYAIVRKLVALICRNSPAQND